MEGQLFYTQRPILVLVEAGLILFVSAVIGAIIGRRSAERSEGKSQIGTIQASVLGILGLLLGFTFAIASSRYDTRRVLAIDEANALGTSFMRAQMLPEPHRTAIARSLSRYIDLRVRALSIRRFDLGKQATLKEHTERLQQTIWRQAAVAGRENNNEMTSLFISSLNDSIDLYASRTATFFARVPDTILWTLLCIAIIALGMVGYGFGLAKEQGWLVMALVSVMVAAVMVMIVDLDRPEAGPTRVSQETILNLRKNLNGYELKNMASPE